MKAISIKQPWANMIASGEKTIETRKWFTAYRGKLLVVSSKRPAIPPAGYALAIADLVDCRMMRPEDERRACCEPYQDAWSWFLENIQPIVPKPVKGRLGLYDVEVEIELAALDAEKGE